MSAIDFIKFKVCDFKFPRLSGKAFSAFVADKLKEQSLSDAVEVFITYITNAEGARSLLRHFDDSEFFIKYVGDRALTQTQKEYASELLKIIVRQREVLILSFIRFWAQTGNVRALKGLLRQSGKLSYSLRAYLKHELAAWEMYIYCSVRFPTSDRTYYYIAEDENVCVGDTVLVPAGEDNVLTEAEIVKIGRYTYDTVPLPLQNTKKIHSRID